MPTKLKAFLTTKFYFTQGQVITQGMLYQLEKKVSELNNSVRGHKASYTRLQGRYDLLEEKAEYLTNANLILEERLKRTPNEKDSIGE